MSDPQGLKLDIVRRFLERGETASALSLIAAMRRENVDVPELDLLQGIALRDQGMSGEAERLLLLAQKRLGRSAKPYAELCILYGGESRVEEAIASCTRATELDANDPRSWNNLAYVLLGANQTAEAVVAAQHAVGLDGSQARYKNNLGFALAATQEWDDAFDTFRSVGTEADAWYNLGIAYDHAGRAAEARSSWEHALESEPNYAAAILALSTAADTETETIPGSSQPGDPIPNSEGATP